MRLTQSLDLSPEARILYSSDSIVDVLGHTPDEVVNRTTWDFFNPTDISSAKQLHKRSITMDKASVLVYCDIRNRDGALIRCECCFSIVYNVMVACTSIYREGPSGTSMDGTRLLRHAANDSRTQVGCANSPAPILVVTRRSSIPYVATLICSLQARC
jgi:PAS domain S-box-containing protein